MATSQAHTLGEFIGAFFENLMKKPIREFAARNQLYFDTIGYRRARGGRKVTWTDVHGSKHDLDFVVEKGGTDDVIGEPVAFIELAWRRYTKHSKNKAQEIAGAVDPICEKYNLCKPFKGAILCGLFTTTSLDQLRNDDFHVLYIPFEKLVSAFRVHGFDVDYDEDSKEADIRKKYSAVSRKANQDVLEDVGDELLKSCEEEICQFLSELEASFRRRIKSICVLPLHGRRTEVFDIGAAIKYIDNYTLLPDDQRLEYIEVVVTYSNGSIIRGQFKDKVGAIDFLNSISS